MMTQQSLPKSQTLYQTDFYAWTQRQATHLRDEEFSEVDWQNLIEEIEDMGNSQRQALTSHLVGLLLHLLKYAYQKQRRSKSWLNSINNHRTEIEIILDDSHSLATELEARLLYAYPKARRNASKETGLPLSTFPVQCPWQVDQVLNFDWLP